MKAFLKSWKQIQIDSFTFINQDVKLYFSNELIDFHFVDKNVIEFNTWLETLSKHITLVINGEQITVSKDNIPLLKDFDYAYAVENATLGPICEDDKVTFNLWAPLCEKVFLLLEENEYELTRGNKGLFSITLNGDYDNKTYLYKIIRDGKEYVVTDPYAKSSTANSLKSAIINLNRHSCSSYDECLDNFKNNVDAVIYEAHIRDLTSFKGTNIINKGKYKGLIEKGAKTRLNYEAGFDYLASLKFSHLQLLPLLDFGSVNELKEKEYNWGYDPVSFFALEGSYSLEAENPLTRMKEFQNIVQEFHKINKRIIMDVVYNHVYKIEKQNFNIITPNYYFRFEDGKLANHSWCGNDFASERVMARKMILDSISFLLDFYHVDGFRFDLMGLIDVETMQKVVEIAKKQNKKIMIYGEGWDMFAKGFNNEKFANMKNASLLKDVAFFNDSYRGIMRGHGFKAKLDESGYLLGNKTYQQGFKFAYLGSSLTNIYPKLFDNVNQSINYVECHDNATIADVCDNSLNDDYSLSRMIKIFNKTIAFSFGIPFYHMGQEIGLSKKGHNNTYNEGDLYNGFNYDTKDQRLDLIQSFNSYIDARKIIKLFSEPDINKIIDRIDIIEHNGINEIVLKDEKTYHIFFNPTNEAFPLNNKNLKLFVPTHIVKNRDTSLLNLFDIPMNRCSIFIED